jgi:hypothetical protein
MMMAKANAIGGGTLYETAVARAALDSYFDEIDRATVCFHVTYKHD